MSAAANTAITTAASRPPASTTPQAELVDAVRHWVHFDNLSESLNKQVTNARSMRATFEEKILKILDSTGMPNAVLQITGATLQRATRAKSADLSWTYLETNLHDYYNSKGRADETAAVLEFLQSRRGVKTSDYLKKTASS
jgi:hypothetical protein